MKRRSSISRRQFVGSAVSSAIVASLPPGKLSWAAAGGSADLSPVPSSPTNPEWKDQGVLNLAKSPYAKLRNVPVRAVTITSGFWAARRQTNVEKSIPSMEKLLEANGRMDNFLRLASKSEAPQRGPAYSDSDVYKWMEAAGFALQSADQPELRDLADKIIKEIVAVQEPSGYLNTYYVGEHAKDRMTSEVQRWGHELYNIGHMIQGAIAYYRATGDRTLLDAGIRFVDGFLLPNF
ncbi:MAG TPA: beta-L-arabinofuranosidase domain-containing protein, partial [Candidatus Dormibacteraeota bacterium]|nr:beta-L-arabinofuranosidase domain-containing protein [Candidatus Dormibacteraeota bacterium]